MKIIEKFLTKNPCYICGRTITPKGLMLHSVGCPQPSAMVFVNNWNPPANGREVCVHGFIDGNTGDIYQTLPWNRRGWHAGGSANNTHIGVEMCEPACIKYTGGSSFTCSDTATAKAVVKRTYDAAVELFAYLCKQYGLDPTADGVIISHKEGCARGVASNHGDPEHLWKGLNTGYTMDGFRKAVKAAMGGASSGSEEQAPANGTLYRVQCGAFSVKANADKLAAQLKAKGFDTYIVVVGNLYKVQTGAYSVKANADAQLKKVKAAGFDAFITTEAGKAATSDTTTKSDTIAVGDKVKCNAGVTKFSNGAKMASWVPTATLYVRQIESGGKILLVSTEKTKAVYTGRVNASDVHKI